MTTQMLCARVLRSPVLRLLCMTLGVLHISSESFADTVLQAKLVPSIVIDGPLGSLQQVQYSTNLTDTNAWTILSYVRLDTTPKAFYDHAANGSKRFYRTKMVGVADTNLVWIPPGTFLMGSPADEEDRIATATGNEGGEGPQTLVTLTKGFLMGRYEVQNSEWLVYMTNAPIGGDSDTNNNYYQRAASLGNQIALLYPLATNYCALRTAAEQQNGLIPPGWYYRLPTEAEWEYACRAGSTNPFALGSGLELRNDVIRQDAAFDGTHPYPTNVVPVAPVTYAGLNLRPSVGSFFPNAFGLYDMHGNAMEICWDFVGDNLPGGTVTNLVGADPMSVAKVVGRGGSAFQSASDSRSARRRFNNGLLPSGRSGFRVVLIPTDEP